MDYLRLKYRQLAPRGRLIIRDVIGPEDLDDPVHLWLTDEDGSRWQDGVEGQEVGNLSTLARFYRFARDYLPQRRDNGETTLVPYQQESINGRTYIVTTHRLSVEYMTKKDYIDNWESEMHEEFAYWSFADWKNALRSVGFIVKEASHTYTNEWIVKNRWENKVALFRRHNDLLIPLPYPPTTAVLVAQKPEEVDDLRYAY
jgi:hypothetical protein